MNEEQKEPKYYRIRADIFWSVVALIIVTCIVEVLYFRKNLQSPEAQSTKERVEVTCDNLSSQLKDINQCCLCGDNEISLMGYYRKFDTIGLISLNDLYVLDFRLKEYDENGNEAKNSEGVNTTYGNTGEITYHNSGTPTRGMADMDITVPDDYRLDKKFLEKNLCQACLDKVSDSLNCWRFEDEKQDPLPLCLVDFETLEIYPVQNEYSAYFIRDYWIEIENDGNDVKIEAFYLPER